MRFHISRTSCCPDDKDESPCLGARWLPYTRVAVHSFGSPEEYDARWEGHEFFGVPVAKWHESGSNHRLHPKGIAKDFPSEGWFIELGMEDLMRFLADEGRIVMGPPGEDGIPSIEIYDSYRE